MGMSKFRSPQKAYKITKEINRKSRTKLRDKRREQGLCVNCGKTNDRENKVLCSECANKAKIKKQEKEKGLCKKCKKENDRPGERLCNECFVKYNIKKEKQHEKQKEYVRNSRAKIRQNRKEQGLCTECGMPNDREGKLFCTSCHIRYSEIQKKRYNEKINNGLCVTCVKPNDRLGFTKCTICYEKEIKYREDMKLKKQKEREENDRNKL